MHCPYLEIPRHGRKTGYRFGDSASQMWPACIEMGRLCQQGKVCGNGGTNSTIHLGESTIIHDLEVLGVPPWKTQENSSVVQASK
jgi:hypothetical protein